MGNGDMAGYEAQKPEELKPAGNVLELLDRILDKGIVIVGDIRISVADIELLKIQIRLLISSVDKAKELGIDFEWAKSIEQTKTKEDLQKKVDELESLLYGQKPGTKPESATELSGKSEDSTDTTDTTDSAEPANSNTGSEE
jgi:hypothetical protein